MPRASSRDRSARTAMRSCCSVKILASLAAANTSTPYTAVKGQPPALDLARERALLELLGRAAAGRLLRSAHDCSDGGVAVTLAECVFDSGGIGCSVDVPAAGSRLDATLFGESASRVVVSAGQHDTATLLQLAAELGVPARIIGTTGGSRITIT